MTPEGIAWQILKFQPGQRGGAAKRMSEDEMLEEAKERALHQPIGKHTYEEAVKMYLYEIRRDAERAQQKPVDSEFDSPEEEADEDMTAFQAGLGTGAGKMRQQQEAMRMLGQSLAQQRQPGM